MGGTRSTVGEMKMQKKKKIVGKPEGNIPHGRPRIIG
jgi:hypothetical protein